MTNKQALGYMVIAAKWSGLNPTKIEEIANNMNRAIDEKTEREAGDAYRKL